jgi:NADH dehydrogenase
VLLVWLSALVAGRDIVSLLSVQNPREAFVAAGVPRVTPVTRATQPQQDELARAA